jgi:hypothetical protein
MKKIFIILSFSLLYVTCSFAATKVWNGAAGDGDWTNSSNWQTNAASPVTPTTPPGVGDIARFDATSGTDTVTSATSISILRIVIRDGANITFDLDLIVGGNSVNEFAVIGYGIGGSAAFIGSHTYQFRSDVDNNNKGTITSNNASPLHIIFGSGTTVQFTSHGGTPTITNAFKMHEGSVENYGNLSIAGGYNLKALQLQSGATFLNSGYINMGTRQIQTQAGSMFINDKCAVITNTNYMATNGSSFINNGYINKGTSGNGGTPTNNGFYTGTWSGIDNVPSTGIELTSGGSNCTVAPIYAVDTSGTGYTWQLGVIPYGSNTAAGLNLNPALNEGGSITITPTGCAAAEYAGLSVMISCLAPLPFVTTHFRAISQGDHVRLLWETIAADENQRFFVEKMKAGDTVFETLEWVPERDSHIDTSFYSYSDRELQPGVLYYYRLKQVDPDGEVKYSNVESASIEKGGKTIISVYPNPARDFVMISSLQSNDISSVKIYSLTGQLMAFQMENIGDWERRVHIGNLPPGEYFVVCVTYQGEGITHRLQIID